MNKKEYFESLSFEPRIVIFQVGKHKKALKLAQEKLKVIEDNGIEATLRGFDQEYLPHQMEADIQEIAPWVDGIIIQKPLPDGFDIDKMKNLIPETHRIDDNDPSVIIENFISKIEQKAKKN